MTEPEQSSVLLYRLKNRAVSLYSLFLLAALAFFINNFFAMAAEGLGRNGVLGGPIIDFTESDLENHLALLTAASPPGAVFDGITETAAADDTTGLFLVDGALLSNKGAVLGGALTKEQNGILSYKVQEGDNLSKIAAQFGISLNTILWANAGAKKHLIRPGDELVILPISGVLYEVAAGDTVASIAAQYSVAAEKIIESNNLDNPAVLAVGEKVIIPSGKPLRQLASLKRINTDLPNLSGFFAFPMPQDSWNWGVLHGSNAVDIANVCGTSVYAAARGVVIKTGSPSRWNSGSGGYVIIEHENSTETFYAHTQKNFVELGSLVEQGDTIAEVGSTGNVQGRTGCHLHFGVSGAKNPFVK